MSPPHFPSQDDQSVPYQDYQGNNGYYPSPLPPPHLYSNMNNSYFPPSYPQGPMFNDQGWNHRYAPTPTHNPPMGWNSPSFHQAPEYGGSLHHSPSLHPQYNHQIRSSLFLDDRRKQSFDHSKRREEEEGDRGDGRWGEGGRPPSKVPFIPLHPSRHRYNSLRSGTSSSSSEPEVRGGLSRRELREYSTLIQDLWKDQRFAQEFKKYDIREYIRIKDLLEQVNEKRRE